jgi:hypothetical protein
MEIGVWRNWSANEAGNVDENGELGAVGANWWAYPLGMANYTAVNMISKFNITFNTWSHPQAGNAIEID